MFRLNVGITALSPVEQADLEAEIEIYEIEACQDVQMPKWRQLYPNKRAIIRILIHRAMRIHAGLAAELEYAEA